MRANAEHQAKRPSHLGVELSVRALGDGSDALAEAVERSSSTRGRRSALKRLRAGSCRCVGGRAGRREAGSEGVDARAQRGERLGEGGMGGAEALQRGEGQRSRMYLTLLRPLQRIIERTCRSWATDAASTSPVSPPAAAAAASDASKRASSAASASNVARGRAAAAAAAAARTSSSAVVALASAPAASSLAERARAVASALDLAASPARASAPAAASAAAVATRSASSATPLVAESNRAAVTAAA